LLPGSRPVVGSSMSTRSDLPVCESRVVEEEALTRDTAVHTFLLFPPLRSPHSTFRGRSWRRRSSILHLGVLLEP